MQRNKKQSGFTIIELLVVISIIGLLASIIMVAVRSAQVKAKQAAAIQKIQAVAVALELYQDQNGRYPTFSGDYPGLSCSAGLNELSSDLLSYIKLSPDPDDNDQCYDYWSANLGEGQSTVNFGGGPTWGGGCLRITNGFYLSYYNDWYAQNPAYQNDGGINPVAYERWGGDLVMGEPESC